MVFVAQASTTFAQSVIYRETFGNNTDGNLGLNNVNIGWNSLVAASSGANLVNGSGDQGLTSGISNPDRPLDSWYLKQTDKRTGRIYRANNLYFGGGKPHVPGVNDLVADPLFVNPSEDSAKANFHLTPASPALKAGRWEPFTPAIDLDAKARPSLRDPSIGAYQFPAGS